MAKDLYFRTNSRHIGQLGRELVTDFVTALVELIKNAYDADAGSVQIRIENVNTPNSRIVIVDTGSGMTQEDFEKKWMVIGTSNKVNEPYTPRGRKRTGKKGIGRFSVERLAEKVTIYSFSEQEDFKVSINWNRYEEISVEALTQRIRILQQGKDSSAAKFIANQLDFYLLLPDLEDQERKIVERYTGVVENYELLYKPDILEQIEDIVLPILKKKEGSEYSIDSIGNPMEAITNRTSEENYKELVKLKQKEKNAVEGEKTTGIVMVLDRLRDTWRQKDIDKLQKELRLLVAPEFIERDPFYIELLADQFKLQDEMSVNSILDISYAQVKAQITEQGKKSVIKYKDKEGNEEEIENTYDEPLLCGDISMELYYFLRDSAHMKNETYGYRYALRVLDTYCGIKIYRDNFRVKPYGDSGNDWLLLDKNKVKDTNSYLVGNNQTIGAIKISDESNPLLVDATNREGIIENEAYEQLKNFVLKSIAVISDIRKAVFDKSKSDLDKAKEEQRKQQEEAKRQQKEQDKYFQETLSLLKKGVVPSTKVIGRLETWKKKQEQSQKEANEQQEKTEEAYQKVLEYQENELSMYKNLATLGILTGNFGHETQDIISRIKGGIAFYEALAPRVENPDFSPITEIMKDDFGRISGYSSMIVEFLRKHKRQVCTDLNLGMVLDNVCKLYYGMLQRFQINFTWNAEDAMVYTMRQIDLESIIINMITNAFEQVKGRSERKIHIQFTQDEENIYLEFEDSGSGVPIENREKLFRAFETTKEDGIGLGLNIVKDIVTTYKGTVQVTDSQNFGGARFLIQFERSKKDGTT